MLIKYDLDHIVPVFILKAQSGCARINGETTLGYPYQQKIEG